MTVFAALMEQIERSVHPDAHASDAVRLQHRTFIVTRLGLSFLAIVTLLLGFAAGHLPAAWEAIALAWLTVPMGATLYVSRTGRLGIAQAAGIVAWLGFAVVASLHGALTPSGGVAVLVVIVFEAAISLSAAIIRFGVIAACLSLVGLVIGVCSGGLVHDAGDGAAELWLLAPILFYAMALASLGALLQIGYLRRAAAELRRHRVLIEAVGDLVLRCDKGGAVLVASAAAEPMFHVAPRDLLGRGFFEHVHVSDRPAFLKTLGDAAASGMAGTVVLKFRIGVDEAGAAARSGPRFAAIELRAIRSEDVLDDGSPAMIMVVRDVSAQMEHEEVIRQARDEAERANAWKGAFIANVSHELRTPLNAIIGFSEILANKDLSPSDPAKRQEYAGIITDSGQHLLSVVNSLLDVSKIEAGRFDLDPEPFDFPSLIQTCCDMVGLKAEQAGIAIVREGSAAFGTIVGDKRACKQIVLNLLSNALKFTARGGRVTIGVRAQGPHVLLTVSDTGVGIAASDLERVGDAFFQARSGYDRACEGTGLGLSVVRGLVGLHGGSITLDSALGEGTQVVVRLPFDCRTAKAKPTAAIDIVPRLRSPAAFVGTPGQTRMQKRA